MGMFGKSLAGYSGAGLSPQDRLMLLGATLRDTGGALRGDSSNALLETQGLLAARQQEAQKNAFLAQLGGKLGPQYDQGGEAPTVGAGGNASSWQYQPPQRTSDGMDINSPELPGLALEAMRRGVNLAPILDVLKAQQADIQVGPGGEAFNTHDRSVLGKRFRNPTAIANTVVDVNNPDNENRVIPEAPVKGAMPVYDNRGRVVDWQLPPGTRDTIGQASQAERTGQTFGTVFNRPNEDGSTSPTLGRDMFGGGAPGGAGRTQRPDDAAYAADLAKAAAGQYTGIQAAGQKAGANIVNYTRMGQLLEGLNTGRLTPTALEFTKAAASVGLKVNPAWSRVEAADALSKKLALDAMGGSLGAGFSNADRSFVEAMNPSVMNTPQGRQQMIAFGVARAKREQQVASMARQWQSKAGRLDKPDRNGKTFFDYLDAYAEANPLMAR